MPRIESLLSARLFLVPQLAGDRIYFISNLSGQMSLYAMDFGGSVPEPLLPPQIALQNPTLMNGIFFSAFLIISSGDPVSPGNTETPMLTETLSVPAMAL